MAGADGRGGGCRARGEQWASGEMRRANSCCLPAALLLGAALHDSTLAPLLISQRAAKRGLSSGRRGRPLPHHHPFHPRSAPSPMAAVAPAKRKAELPPGVVVEGGGDVEVIPLGAGQEVGRSCIIVR